MQVPHCACLWLVPDDRRLAIEDYDITLRPANSALLRNLPKQCLAFSGASGVLLMSTSVTAVLVLRYSCRKLAHRWQD